MGHSLDTAGRTIAERLTHRLVLLRRLPPPFERVRIYASTEGGLRYLRPKLDAVDPVLLRLVTEVVKPGAVVWDIGANLGLFTFAAAAAARPAGRVLAVEADAWLATLLRRSAARNRAIAPVDVLPVAAGDRVGIAKFTIARRARSANHLTGYGTTEAGGTRRVDLVPTVMLDSLLDHFPPPDVVKIDVEEAEALVLSGASAVLAGRPTLICEVAAGNAEQVRKLLSPYGYRFYDGTLPRLLRTPLDQVPWGLLAVPAR
jgi:FkbM family methyltransferase